MRRLLAVFVAALATAALGWGSRIPYTPEGADDAVLRLSWRLRGEREQKCRPRTQAELDALPVHMRTPEVCTGHMVSYILRVQIDGAAPDTQTFRPAGAKGDRPIFVLFEKPLVPGTHQVVIDFTPTESVSAEKRKPLNFAGTISTKAGGIELITLSSDNARLVHRR